RLTLGASEPTCADTNPYRGLYPFEAEHRGLFFGRAADTRAIQERLRYDPFVLVAGDSGVGKSSLCRAGVLPLVQAAALGDGESCQILRIAIGRRPMTQLRAALANDPTEVGRELLRRHGEGFRLLLFIDQLEELITLSEVDEAGQFSEALTRLL